MSELSLLKAPPPVDSDADLGAVVALAGLPGLTPQRFWSLLELGAPHQVWQRVRDGGAPRTGRERDAALSWPQWAAMVVPADLLQQHRAAGLTILPFGQPGYPPALLEDPEPPVVLFSRGARSMTLSERSRIAVVGTRDCSNYGRDIAFQLGRLLAKRGVDVVSGLASGIDAAAHAGVIETQPGCALAVVAGGVDVIYPKSNRGLYRAIGEAGAVISEWPLGSRPDRWRFPARNRLVAALSAAVVVVESRVKGGSMYTVDEAIERHRSVFAVPGNIFSPVSAGTNQLIAQGANVLSDIGELVDAVAPVAAVDPDTIDQDTAARDSSAAPESWLLEAIGWEPASLDGIVMRSGRTPVDVTLEVERMIGAGVIRRQGAMVERVGR